MSFGDEMRDARFGDARLSRRLMKLSEDLGARPAESFPKATGTQASLEATYRFLRHPSVTPEAILQPHIDATIERASMAGSVVVAHDTTQFSFPGEREGLGRINDRGQGFFAHVSLVVAPPLEDEEIADPLGIAAMCSFTRQGQPRHQKQSQRRPIEDRESRRWIDSAITSGERLRGKADVVHVMDCEADFYELMSPIASAGHHFVIRLRFNRSIENEEGGNERLNARLERSEIVALRHVPLSARPRAPLPGQRQRHPPRTGRTAKLGFAVASVSLCRPADAPASLPLLLPIQVVHVFELDPPPDCEPVDWRLVTNEVVRSPASLLRVVDLYRARWTIEEFFKALKTGCAFEKRQLESKATLLNALAVFMPIAWQLLRLRALSRLRPDAPAPEVLSAFQLRVLRAHPHVTLPRRPKNREVWLAVARLGGHITNNGPPGWQVLGRGLEELLRLELGARIAAEM